MNWLKRYVHAVKYYLPNKLKDDVADELYADLQDQCDDQAAELGRELTQQEYHQILLKRGHPMSVAASYQPHKTLVSAELFPVYCQVLKWVMFVLFMVQCIAALVKVFIQLDPNFVQIVLSIIRNTLNSGLTSFAIITIIFYLIGENITRKAIFKDWHPKTLSKTTSSGDQISIFESIVGLLFQLLFLGWINNLFSLISIHIGVFTVNTNDQLQASLPLINFVLLLGIAFSVCKILYPYWSKKLIWANWLHFFVSFIVLIVLYQINAPLNFEVINSEGVLSNYQIPSSWWRNLLMIIGFVFIIEIFFSIRRYLRLI
ncbi:MAG: hypothetical protein HRU38_09635 [Saccharospirillaceae bacterium]|nr:hypothetical protein [Pseudomonadales bacterium]NRB78913.1 hypothetical protein [Saccharospirillaceae bacterium]